MRLKYSLVALMLVQKICNADLEEPRPDFKYCAHPHFQLSPSDAYLSGKEVADKLKEKSPILNQVAFVDALKIKPELSEFLIHPALNVATESLQIASYEGPRSFFQHEGVFLASPGAHPTVDGSETFNLEGFEFVRSTREWRSFEVDPATGAYTPNPERCHKCHGNPPKPIWDAQLHPGFLNQDSQDDDVFYVDRFLPKGKRHPFYEAFLSLPSTSIGIKRRDEFGWELLVFNLHRVAKQLTSDPGYSLYKFALVGSLVGCENLPSFFPEPIRKTLEEKLKTTFKKLNEDTAAKLKQEFAGKVERREAILKEMETKLDTKLPRTAPYDRSFKDVPFVTGLRYIYEGRGWDLRDWSISTAAHHNETSYDHMIGGDVGGLKALACILFPKIWDSEDFKFMKESIDIDDGMTVRKELKSGVCEELAKRSVQKFQTPPPPSGTEKSSGVNESSPNKQNHMQ